jgi:inner membrane protease ATP23
MCENKKVDIETFEHTVVHELVHAYDVCRAKIDFKNCVQHACTEIRASTLSGECGIIHDLARGHFKLHGGREDCVKRRATLSVEMNPSCAVSPNFFYSSRSCRL